MSKPRRIGDLVTANLNDRLTRRDILKRGSLFGLSVPVLAAIMNRCSDDEEDEAQEWDVDPVPGPEVDQVKGRRYGTGLRGYNPDKAYDGFTLFAPINGDGTVYLIDMYGNVEHTWDLPHPPGLYGYLTPEGTLFYNGQTSEDSTVFLNSVPFKGGAALEVDWDGNTLNEVRHPDHHHDGIKLSNGNVMLLCLKEIPDDLAARVQGGREGSEADGTMYADYLVELTPDGETVWEWRSWEHLDPEVDGITAVQDSRAEWTHGNAVSELRNGNLAVSFRTNSTVAIVDRETGELTFKLGAPPLAQQHAPVELENGNLLIFDNGTHRLDHFLPYSRVIEVDPETSEIVWTYQETDVMDFYSPLISNAQRLPNGNTLICEGNFGRFFEVTAEGEVVWEYVSPYFHQSSDEEDPAIGNEVFRCYRYSEEEIAQARRAGRASL